eukprot:6271106-Pyramimonas_sp.AAC.1
MDTECEEKTLPGISFEGNLDALGGSLYLRVLRDALNSTSVIQGWGPRAFPLIIRCTTHLEDAS